MAAPSYPGVYIEEKPSAPSAVQGVSTSILALIGWTEKGPTDELTLVTSMTQYKETFGDFNSTGLSPHMAYAFFKNGGQLLYMVRVAGSGAEEAVGYITNDGYEQTGIEVGDGKTVIFTGTLDAPPEPGSLDISYYYDGTPLTLQAMGTGDGKTTNFGGTIGVANRPVKATTFDIVFYVDSAPVAGENVKDEDPNGIKTIFDTAVNPANIKMDVPATLPIKPGSYTFRWQIAGPVTKSQTVSALGVFSGDGNPAGSTIDWDTGAIVIDATGEIPMIGSIVTCDYTPMIQRTAADDGAGGLTGTGVTSGAINYGTGVWTLVCAVAPTAGLGYTTLNGSWTPLELGTISDDGAGALTGDVNPVGTNTIDYETGEYAFEASDAPTGAATYRSVDAEFNFILWRVDMQWPGLAGNDFRITLEGTPGYEDDVHATFTRWTFKVWEENADGGYDVKETFEGLHFTDSTDPDFFPTAVNDENAGSSLVTVVDLNETGVPTALSGEAVTNEVIGIGNGTNAQFTGVFVEGACHPTTITITATKASDDSTMTVTDDGNGNLIGDVLGSGTNTIDYDAGTYNVTFEGAVKNLTNVEADYYTAPTYSEDAPWTEDMAGGTNGAAVASSDIVGAGLEADKKGLFALNTSDEMMQVVIPDFAGDETTDGALVDYCEERMDRFAILTCPEGCTPQEAVNYKKNDLAKNTSYAALYYPWVKILDPVTEKAVNLPPMGHIAGIYARTDSTKNVGKAPAGVEDGAVRWQIGLERELNQSEVGVLTQQKINCLVNWSQIGTVAVWGARTLQVGGEFPYIQMRRLFMYVEKSIYNATHIYVFENNSSSLWARIRLQLTGFLLRLYSQGYLAGNSAEEAFFVTVDSTNNTQETIDAGLLIVDVGIAPNKPAEFIVFRFQQYTQS